MALIVLINDSRRWSNDLNPDRIEDNLDSFLSLYKNIFSKEVYEYMNSLIHMESLILKDTNMIDLRKRLMDIDIYRIIAGYNIFNHLLHTLNNINNRSLIINVEDCSLQAYTKQKNNKYVFLSYYFYPNLNKEKRKNITNVGQIDVSLYKEKASQELKQEQIELTSQYQSISKRLEVLKNYNHEGYTQNKKEKILKEIDLLYSLLDNLKLKIKENRRLSENNAELIKLNKNNYYQFIDKLGIQETELKQETELDDKFLGIETRLVKQYPETNINVLVKKR